MITLPIFVCYKGVVYGRTGRRDDAVQMLHQLEDLSKRQYVPRYQFGVIYLGIGDIEAWRQTMRDSYAEREGSLLFMKRWWWAYDSVQTDPVFQEIVAKMGLP